MVVLTFVMWFVDVERRERECWWWLAGDFEQPLLEVPSTNLT